MSANPIWIAGYFGPVAGAAPVWIAPGDGTVPSAVQSEIVSYYAPVAGATAVWIAGFFAPPPAAIGATPITISGWGGSGGGGGGTTTSVWSAADAAANGMTLSNGGLTVVAGAGGYQSIRGTVGHATGKYYVEFKTSGAVTGNMLWGMASSSFVINNYLGTSDYSVGSCVNGVGTFASPSASFTINYGVPNSPAANDVWAIAVDLTAGKFWIAQNNVWIGSLLGNVRDPSSGTLPMATFTPPALGQAYFPTLSLQGGSITGVWTLQSTAASQKYAPPSGFAAWDSVAPTHSAEALAYLARTVGGNEGGNGANIATLIDGLVSDGVWAKLDALYVLAQQNQTDALLNLVGTSYGLTSVGVLRSAVFTQYVGFYFPVPAGVYLDTGFDPTVAPAPHYTPNSASYGLWAYAATAADGVQMGQGASNDTAMYIKFASDGNFYGRLLNTSAGVTSTITKGVFAVDRSDASNVLPYQNGASAGPISAPANAMVVGSFEIGSAASSGQSASQTLSAAFIGASLGAAGQLALYNRLRTYMSSVGVP